MSEPLRHLSLFSGVGGIDLAAEWAGFRTVLFCEQNRFCQQVLQKHWPNVPIVEDIRTLTIDIVANHWYTNLLIEQQEGVNMAATRKQYDGAVDMYNTGSSIGDCADYYGISRQAMWAILRRREVVFRSHLRQGAENHFYRGGAGDHDHAHNLVETAVQRGTIIPLPCEICGVNGTFEDGRREVQAHHDDYNFPLRVRWLCQRCHHEWHKHNRAIENRKEVMPSGSDGTIDLVSGGFP